MTTEAFRFPDGSALPTWAEDNPLVQASINLYREVVRLAETTATYFADDKETIRLARVACEKRLADLHAAVARCKPPESKPELLSFAKLCEMEPRLRDLERSAKSRASIFGRQKGWCANAAWFGYGCFAGPWSPKAMLVEIVGWIRRRDPSNPHDGVLRSSEAYDVAYDYLSGLLPDCRHSGRFC